MPRLSIKAVLVTQLAGTLLLSSALAQVPPRAGAISAPAPAQPVVPLAMPFRPPPAPVASAAVKPDNGPFTLAQATQGLSGTGTLRAAIELEQSGKALGTLRCELFADKTPLTVANFVGLARGLRTFRDEKTRQWVRRSLYDGNQLHRLIPDYLIQGGDPLCLADPGCMGRHGAGDPGYAIADEIRDDLRFDRGGRLGMSLRGAPGSAGAQFFITERDTPWLNGTHTLFGQCEPVDVIRTISHLPTQALDVPKVPVRIKRVVITRQQPPIK